MSININEIKNKIKNWEKEFTEFHKRVPKGKDILLAPKEIIDMYKVYKNQKQNKITNVLDPWMAENSTSSLAILNVETKHEETLNIWNIKGKLMLTANDKVSPVKSKDQIIRHDRIALRQKYRKELKKNFNGSDKENDMESMETSQQANTPVKLNIIEENSKSNEIDYIFKRKFSESVLPKSNFKKSFIEKSVFMNIDNYQEKIIEYKSPVKQIGEVNEIDHKIMEKEIVINTIDFSVEHESNKNLSIEPPAKKICYAPEVISKPVYKRPKENYVKLNLKFNSYCPKATSKQKARRREFRRLKWKSRMKCFRCGEEGHYSNNCSQRAKHGPADEKSDRNVLGFTDINGTINLSDFRFQNLKNFPNEITKQLYCDNNNNIQTPIDNEKIVLNKDDIDECMKKSMKIFGFSTFRNHQEKIIRRICANQSTVAILPTGSGKSLCYQIPAYIFQQTKNSVALIVSPLISLMQDQLSKLPKEIQAISLNSTMKFNDKLKALKEINEMKYSFILLSPEALVECNWLTADKLPPISFACIDEVHCLSDWSHHFRPSYLRVCKLLRENYQVNCFLGLSATCTQSTIECVLRSLKINRIIDPDSCIINNPIPDNITISVCQVKNKDRSLIKLLQKSPFNTSRSILIYCSTREETMNLADFIRERLESVEIVTSKKKLTWTVQAYHAGLKATDRAKLQRMFMRGRIRVLVATIAFGMGLDKSDIRAVIHYSRPKSFENYVQEIGRAGRDSLPANAVVLLSKDLNAGNPDQQNDEELNDLHRYTYKNHVELLSVKRFVKILFDELLTNKCIHKKCQGHIVGFSPSAIAERLNIGEETLMTLICYMELYEEETFLKILPANYRYGKLSCYRGGKQLADLSQKSLIISTAFTIEYSKKNIDIKECQSVEIDLIEMWDQFGFDASFVRRELKSFEWNQLEDKDSQIRYSNTGITNEFTEWNWIFAIRCDNSHEFLDKIINYLHLRLDQLETRTINDVENLHQILMDNSTEFSELFVDENEKEIIRKSSEIRKEIIEHFNCNEKKINSKKELKTYPKALELETRYHIREFITKFKTPQISISGRSIASVLHGIDCPYNPSTYWRSQKMFWKSMLKVDFITLMNWANEELKYFL